MTFVEVTVGAEKQILHLSAIERILPSAEGASVCVRGPSKNKLYFVHVKESYKDLTQMLDAAGAKIHRLGHPAQRSE